MLINHKRYNTKKTDQLSEYDIRDHYIWVLGYRGNRTERGKYWKIVSQIPLSSFMKKWKISSVTRVTNDGICLDCKKKRCTICNGYPIDIFEELKNCQRCICYGEKEQSTNEPLNDTGIPLDELIRHRRGTRKNKQELNQ